MTNTDTKSTTAHGKLLIIIARLWPQINAGKRIPCSQHLITPTGGVVNVHCLPLVSRRLIGQMFNRIHSIQVNFEPDYGEPPSPAPPPLFSSMNTTSTEANDASKFLAFLTWLRTARQSQTTNWYPTACVCVAWALSRFKIRYTTAAAAFYDNYIRIISGWLVVNWFCLFFFVIQHVASAMVIWSYY